MSEKRKHGFWQSRKNILEEAEKIMQKHNLSRFPTIQWLGKQGYSSIVPAIMNSFGSIIEFRKEIFGEKPSQKASGTYKKLDFCIEESVKIIEDNQLTKLPDGGGLRKLGHNTLVDAIIKYHGGFHSFRKLLGEKPNRIKKGLWNNLDYVLDRARDICEELGVGTLPDYSTLCNKGYKDFCWAVTAYHGMNKIRGMLGEQNLVREGGIWKRLDYTLEQAREIMKKHNLDRLPTHGKLKELGYSSLSAAITTYHGGYTRFRSLLGEDASVHARRLEILEDLLEDEE